MCIVLLGSLASCEKSYTCKCYSYKKYAPSYNKVIGSFELKERNRKNATMICNSRNYTDQLTNQVTECKMLQ